jgi:hypothetical protein
MAINDCAITPQEVQEFAASDHDRLVGDITSILAKRSPFLDVLDGGVFRNGISSTQRNVVQEHAFLGYSLVNPAFQDSLTICGDPGEVAEVGSTEYTTTIGAARGRGPKVCVKKMRSDFQASYSAATDSLKKALVQLMNADVRYTLMDRSGSKLVVKNGATWESMYTGNESAIDTPFQTAYLPDAALSFTLLKRLVNTLREDFQAEPFESESGGICKFIGSQNILDSLRNNLNLREDFRYLAAGKYDMGKNTLTGYTWEGPYRGVVFAPDPQPIRFNTWNMATKRPNAIEPQIVVPTTNGSKLIRNAEWAQAKFEVGHALFANSFRRLVPEKYTGASEFRFPPQMTAGELEFITDRDWDCNLFRDYGIHIWEIERGYMPIRPWAVVAIAYKRCEANFDLETCADFPAYTGADSL